MPQHFFRYYHTLYACLFLLLLSLPASAARQVTLAWDASPDASVLGYRIHYGNSAGQYGTVLDVGPTTMATIGNLIPGADYFFTVKAYSSSLMESAPSNEIIVSITPATPPSAEIATPDNGIQINGPATLNVEAYTNDPDGVLARVELYRGETKISEATTPPFSTVITNLQPGQHSFSAVAIDQAGVRRTSSPVILEVVEFKATQSRMKEDGAFEVTVSGAPGSTNRVWYSDDLVHWELLQTVENVGGNFTVSDPNARSVKQRFYKVTSP